jgi:hypothetical protein
LLAHPDQSIHTCARPSSAQVARLTAGFTQSLLQN